MVQTITDEMGLRIGKKSLTKKEHRILFYGPEKIEEIKSLISKYHNIKFLHMIIYVDEQSRLIDTLKYFELEN